MEGDTDPETLHRARTHLQVLARRLKQFDAPRSDRRIVKRRIKAERRKLDRTHAYETLARLVRRQMAAAAPWDADRAAGRIRTARAEHAASLRRLVARAGSAPRRKALHELRLEIKAVRYQEERLSGTAAALPKLVRQLKRVQTVLGEYEDLVQFRRLARELDLRSASRIEKAWRRARTRARAVPAGLAGLLAFLGRPRIQPVPDTPPLTAPAAQAP
jgi:CHAD domain-containing protein